MQFIGWYTFIHCDGLVSHASIPFNIATLLKITVVFIIVRITEVVEVIEVLVQLSKGVGGNVKSSFQSVINHRYLLSKQRKYRSFNRIQSGVEESRTSLKVESCNTEFF